MFPVCHRGHSDPSSNIFIAAVMPNAALAEPASKPISLARTGCHLFRCSRRFSERHSRFERFSRAILRIAARRRAPGGGIRGGGPAWAWDGHPLPLMDRPYPLIF